MCDEKKTPDAIAINEIQLILAEKRTALAVLRTGIAVLALPLSVMSFLIATSKSYNIQDVMHIFIPLGALNLCLVILGCYLVFRSIVRMKHYDSFIREIKRDHSLVAKFVE